MQLMSKLHKADLYTRVLELQHKLDTQRTKIMKVEKNHKSLRKHYKTMESLNELTELIESFKHENNSASIRIQHYLLRDNEIDMISAINFIQALKRLADNTNELIEDLA